MGSAKLPSPSVTHALYPGTYRIAYHQLIFAILADCPAHPSSLHPRLIYLYPIVPYSPPLPPPSITPRPMEIIHNLHTYTFTFTFTHTLTLTLTLKHLHSHSHTLNTHTLHIISRLSPSRLVFHPMGPIAHRPLPACPSLFVFVSCLAALSGIELV